MLMIRQVKRDILRKLTSKVWIMLVISLRMNWLLLPGALLLWFALLLLLVMLLLMLLLRFDEMLIPKI